MSRVLPILLSSLLVMSNAASVTAEGYQPDEFLGLDLSRAALSPKPLGPANTFGTVPANVGADGDVAGQRAHAKAPHPARAVHVSTPKLRRTEHASTHKPLRTQHVSTQRPRGTARTRLANRHRSLLDAQAMDTRIQVWPCKSGGICKWKQ